MQIKDAGSFVKSVHDLLSSATSFDELREKLYQLLRNGKSDKKAEFALDVIYEIDPDQLVVPPYIAEALEWLQKYLRPEE